MTRLLVFVLAIAAIGIGVLFNAPANAATRMQCEERNANCLGTCRDRTGGAGDLRGRQSQCAPRCFRQLMRCYPVSHPIYVPRV